MTLTSAVVSFALVAGVVTLTPGLDTALVLRTAISRGRRAAFAAAFGVGTGLLVWAVAAAVGVSALVTASETGFFALRTVGALYLLTLGAGMLLGAIRGPAAGKEALAPYDDSVAPRGVRRAFRQGFLTNLLNPKIGAFYVALLPQFLPAGYPPAAVGLLLALVHCVEGLLWFGVIIATVDRMRLWLRRPAVERTVDGVAGATIIGFGLTLGLSHR